MKQSSVTLRVENFRAIGKAEIKLDGITVVAGVNGCGKSTLSKLLYWVYRGVLEFETLFLEPRLNKNIKILKKQTVQILSSLKKDIPKDRLLPIQTKLKENQKNLLLPFFLDSVDVYSAIKKIESYFDNIEKVIELYELLESEANFLDDLLSEYEIIDDLDLILFLDDLDLSDDSLQDNFREYDLSSVIYTLSMIASIIDTDYVLDNAVKPRKIIEKQIQKIFKLEQEFLIPVEIIECEQYDASGVFEIPIISNYQEDLNESFYIENVIYIDTPMFFGHNEEEHWKDANEKLKQRPKFNETPKTIQAIDDLIKHQIFKNGAEVKFDELSKSFTFRTSSGMEIDLSDSATGMKSFAVLDRLVKNGSINSKTLLILDEPEAHLHPQWVVEFGRLLTLINKHIGAKIFVATHSPDMVQALRYIPNKEGIGERVNFYLAEYNSETHLFDYQDLNGKIGEIFKSFNVSMDKLEQYGEE